MIAARLKSIQDELLRLSSRPIQLVAVTKTKPCTDILEAYNAGHRHFGENYVAELLEKCPGLPNDIQWHLIGHLQTNKIQKLIAGCSNLYMVETVDSEKLASKLNYALSVLPVPRADKLKVLIEVKTSSEESKSGVCVPAVSPLITYIATECPYLVFSGLMTIADPLNCENSFLQIRQLKSDLEQSGTVVEVVSMGMSGDYESAVVHGSTEVRIGSSIFGSRI